MKLLLAFFWSGAIKVPLAVPDRVQAATIQEVWVESAAPVDLVEKVDTKTIRRTDVLFMVWLAGVLGGTVRLTYEWRRSAWLKRNSSALEHGVLAELCSLLGIRKRPALRASTAISAPVLIGIVRPSVILPADTAGEELRMMLAHELAHLKRRDLLWGWLPAICHTLFFFHPLLWITRREWLLAQEMACDEMVLRHSVASAAAYGNLLVDIVASAVPRPRFGTLGICETTENLKRRIQGMKTIGNRKNRALMFALFVIGLTGIFPWQIVAQEKPTDSTRRIEQLEKDNANLRQEIEKLKNSANGDQRLRLRMDLLNDRIEREIAIAGLTVASNKLKRAELLVDRRVESWEVLEIAKAEFHRLQTEIASRARSIAEKEAALAEIEMGRETTGVRAGSNDERRERARQLYLEEMALAQKYVDSLRKQFESGRATQDQLFRAQQDLFALKREMAGADSNRTQLKETVQEEIAIVERLLKEAKKRVELGVAPQDEELNLQRELLKLKRELLSIE